VARIKRAVDEVDDKVNRLVQEIRAGNISLEDVADRLERLRRDELDDLARLAARVARESRS
jgi:hypothetical protein